MYIVIFISLWLKLLSFYEIFSKILLIQEEGVCVLTTEEEEEQRAKMKKLRLRLKH